MDVSIDPHWQNLVDDLVRSGRYENAASVVQEGLKLVEERETEVRALRAHLQRSIDRGGEHDAEDVLSYVRERLAGRENQLAAE